LVPVSLLFTRNELQRLAAPEQFERARQLAGTIDDLYDDGWSVFGTVVDDGRRYEAMVHHTPPMSAECMCPDGGPPSFCEHSIAVGLCYLGDERDV
jgi:uncharacterized Zn finger protein